MSYKIPHMPDSYQYSSHEFVEEGFLQCDITISNRIRLTVGDSGTECVQFAVTRTEAKALVRALEHAIDQLRGA